MVARLARVEDDSVKPWAALIDPTEGFGGQECNFVLRVGDADIVDSPLALEDVSKGAEPNDEYFAAREMSCQFVSLRLDGLYSFDRAAMWSIGKGFVYFFRLILAHEMMVFQRFFHARF